MTSLPRSATAVTAALLIASLSGCSSAPDLGEAERRLEGINGVEDADARWNDAGWKIGEGGAVVAAVGDDLDDLVPIGADVAAVTAGLDWSDSLNLAVVLGDEADALPFVSVPDGETPIRPTDLSYYEISGRSLGDRDVEDDLTVLAAAVDLLQRPVQVDSSNDGQQTYLFTTTSLRANDDPVALVESIRADDLLADSEALWRLEGEAFSVSARSAFTDDDVALIRLLTDPASSPCGRLPVAFASFAADREAVTEPSVSISVTCTTPGEPQAQTAATDPRATAFLDEMRAFGGTDLTVLLEGPNDQQQRKQYGRLGTDAWATITPLPSPSTP